VRSTVSADHVRLSSARHAEQVTMGFLNQRLAEAVRYAPVDLRGRTGHARHKYLG